MSASKILTVAAIAGIAAYKYFSSSSPFSSLSSDDISGEISSNDVSAGDEGVCCCDCDCRIVTLWYC